MRTDGIFSLHQVTVKSRSGEEWKLIPFGDVHRDSPAHAEDEWRKFKEYASKQDKVLFLGMGDYLDSFAASERVIMGDPHLHESTKRREENEARGRVSALASELSFMRGKLIGLLSGNHYVQFDDGTTSDMLLASKLSTKFLGVCSAIRISFELKRANRVSVDVFAHHGRGGGMTAGGRMNAVEKLTQVCEADVFLMGDNHARGILPLGDKLRISSTQSGMFLRSRRCWIGRTGSFLRGYVANEPSYVVDRALPPASLGWVEFSLTPRRTHTTDYDRLSVEIGGRQ